MKEQQDFLNYTWQRGYLLKIVLLVASHMFVLEALGQRSKLLPANQPRLSWSVNLPDTSNLDFFRHYPNVSKINMTIRNDKVQSVNLIFNDKNDREYYNLNFRGDILVFRDRYKIPINWVLPKFSTNDINGDYVGYMYDSYSGGIYPDSVILRYYEHHLLSENKKHVGGGGPIPPSFVGKIQDLADSISAELVKVGYKDTGESVAVFEAIVERDGELQSVERILGDSTLFSETVALCLLKDYPDIRRFKRAMWHPAITGGRPIRVSIRIYAELKNGDVVLEKSNSYYSFLPN